MGRIERGAVAMRDASVVWVGPEDELNSNVTFSEGTASLEVEGRSVVPGFVDAHTHLVFAGTRREEFAARAKGASYETGGILSTVAATREASFDILLDLARSRADEMLRHGTTTVEAKSGYGLDSETEIRLLQVLVELGNTHRMDVEVTFLGAHATPPEFEGNSEAYVDLVCSMIAEAASLASWCDVFCDYGAFSPEHAWRVLEAGKSAGMQPRIHANELAASGGVEVAASVGAASADHLLFLEPHQARLLAEKRCVGVLCPVTALGLDRLPDARMMTGEGMTIAIASDFNPGTAFAENLQLSIAIATRSMGVGPEECLLAVTSGGAAALRRTDIGRLTPGSLADAVVLDTDSYLDLGYHAGGNLAWKVIKRGALIE